MDTQTGEPNLPAIPGYEIQRRVGQGGMGIVYKALRLTDARWVALKMIVSTRPDLKQRFRREVNAVARLRHPGIVELYDTGEHGGWPFFTMEFVPGGNLAESLGRYVGDARQAVTLVQSIAEAVHHAHEQGIVHRDLKPGNVLLGENGEPKISDFGLAKCLDAGEEALTNTSAIMGTPAYMAPEVARGEMRDAGPATDVYALGAMLYELLTGQAPFRGRNQLQVLDLIRSHPPQPPRGIRPNLPARLEAICLRCLEKEPAARPGSALELAEELRRVLDVVPDLSAMNTVSAEAAGEAEDPTTKDHIPQGQGQPSTADSPGHDSSNRGLTQPPSIPGFEVLELAWTHGLLKVYRARQTRVGRTVALSWADPATFEPSAVERFRIETEVLSRLQHPNIVQLIDAGEDAGRFYRVEEYLDGGMLAARLKRERMPEREAAALVAALARAVHYLHHALGELVVHRNLKPGVVMFTSAGVAKVAHFGLVHAPSFGTARFEQDGQVVGTPAYMAPEQVQGSPRTLGPGTDVYGLGGILYTALTGRPPNGPAGSPTDLIERLLRDPPVSPRYYNPDVSRRVEKVCLKALEKDPLRRHANPQELAEDLERLNAGWLG